MTPSRRHILQLGASSVLLIFVGGCRRRSEPAAPHHALSYAEFVTLTAVCERILPRDDDPGAVDLGVPDYIDAALASDLDRWRDKVKRGLADLDAAARGRGESSFVDARPAVQDDVIADMHMGRADHAEAIQLIVSLTLEGAFGDPVYGGNIAGAGWILVGFAPCEPHPMGGHHHG